MLRTEYTYYDFITAFYYTLSHANHFTVRVPGVVPPNPGYLCEHPTL